MRREEQEKIINWIIPWKKEKKISWWRWSSPDDAGLVLLNLMLVTVMMMTFFKRISFSFSLSFLHFFYLVCTHVYRKETSQMFRLGSHDDRTWTYRCIRFFDPEYQPPWLLFYSVCLSVSSDSLDLTDTSFHFSCWSCDGEDQDGNDTSSLFFFLIRVRQGFCQVLMLSLDT